MASRSLSWKILAIILAASTIITTVLTAITLFLDYRSELGTLDRNYAQLERLTLGPLSAAVWSFDDAQIQKFLEGIVATGDFVEARLSHLDGSLLYATQREAEVSETFQRLRNLFPEKTIERRYILSIQPSGDFSRELGYLVVTASQTAIIERLWQKLLVIFLMQGVKTLIVSLVILFIIQRQLTRHLLQVIHYLQHLPRRSMQNYRALHLKRAPHHPDELDTLVSSLNAILEDLKHYQKSHELQLEQAERELEAQRMNALHSARLASLGELAGGIAHEINNPLAIIMGSAQRLLRELSLNHLPQAQRCSEQIIQTGDRIARVISSLRKLARDGEDSPKASFSMSRLVQEVMDLTEEKIRRERIELRIDLDPETYVFGNEVEVSQVLFNLLSNAVDAVALLETRWIAIEGHTEGANYVVSVSDSGQGIPTAIAHRIMEPFFTTKEVGRGTGLGLSISLSIAKRHGGDLKLDRSAQHTKFDFILPQIRPSELHEQAKS